jgi:hypothetical protein
MNSTTYTHPHDHLAIAWQSIKIAEAALEAMLEAPPTEDERDLQPWILQYMQCSLANQRRRLLDLFPDVTEHDIYATQYEEVEAVRRHRHIYETNQYGQEMAQLALQLAEAAVDELIHDYDDETNDEIDEMGTALRGISWDVSQCECNLDGISSGSLRGDTPTPGYTLYEGADPLADAADEAEANNAVTSSLVTCG